MHQFRRVGARQCVLNASHLLIYVSMSADRCAGPCYLWLGRFSTLPVCMNTGVLCVCEYDSQRCKLCVWFVYVCVIFDCCASSCEAKRQTAALTSVPGH